MAKRKPPELVVKDDERLIPLRDAAYMLSRSKQAVLRLVNAGVLRCAWENRRVWFRVKWIDEYIDSLPRIKQPKERKP